MNNDLISRSALLESLEQHYDLMHRLYVDIHVLGMQSGFKSAIDKVKEFPAVDAVEVVRCKDCRHRWDEMRCPMYDMSGCFAPLDMTTDEGFCSYGAKRDAEVKPNE